MSLDAGGQVAQEGLDLVIVALAVGVVLQLHLGLLDAVDGRDLAYPAGRDGLLAGAQDLGQVALHHHADLGGWQEVQALGGAAGGAGHGGVDDVVVVVEPGADRQPGTQGQASQKAADGLG